MLALKRLLELTLRLKEEGNHEDAQRAIDQTIQEFFSTDISTLTSMSEEAFQEFIGSFQSEPLRLLGDAMYEKVVVDLEFNTVTTTTKTLAKRTEQIYHLSEKLSKSVHVGNLRKLEVLQNLM